MQVLEFFPVGKKIKASTMVMVVRSLTTIVHSLYIKFINIQLTIKKHTRKCHIIIVLNTYTYYNLDVILFIKASGYNSCPK